MNETSLPAVTAERLREKLEKLREEYGRIIVGQEETVGLLVTAVLADGHVLLEGLPGVGKTLMVKSLARSLSLNFNRIQFTPDLMPADITGTTVITGPPNGERSFSFEPGPLFTNILLADEINRAGPKTQSALLQAMQEKEVSFFGHHYSLSEPFLVFATQNPIEMAGTYPLPEAQLDRFLFKVVVPSPGEEDLFHIARRTTGSDPVDISPVLPESEIHEFRRFIRRIPVADPVLRAITRAVLSTRPERSSSPEIVRRFVRYGVSPRGLQALLFSAKVKACLEGRFNVSVDDIQPYWLPALRHRLILDVSAGVEGVTAESILGEIAVGMAKA